MKKGGGKQKGATFERWICVQLSLWLTHTSFGGERRDVFWRSAMSGGRSTVAARKGVSLKNQAGDITAIDPVGHTLTKEYMIECKHYASLDIESFVLRDTGKLAGFWKKAKAQAQQHGLKPMLIGKQRGIVVMIVPTGTRFYEGAEALEALCSRSDFEMYDFGRVVLTTYGYRPQIRKARRMLRVVQ